MATLRDIAAELGLAVSTVSRALSGQANVEAATRARVLAAAERLRYRPNALARALRRNQTQTVGLVIPDILNDFYASAAAVLQRVLEQQGYRTVLALNNDNPETDAKCLAGLLEQHVDGIVHVPCTKDGARVVRDATHQIPVIEMNRRSSNGEFDAVLSDEREGSRILTQHLLQLGHRRIAMIVGPEMYSTTRDRVDGFNDAFREERVSRDDSSVFFGTYSRTWGKTAMEQVMRRTPRPTAVYASSSQLVLGAMAYFAAAGMHVPADCSVVGLGNPDWYQITHPPLTTYAIPLREMGMIAAQLLLARITELRSDVVVPTVTRLSGHLIIRASAAQPPSVSAMPIPEDIDVNT